MKRIHKITYYSLLLLAFLFGESTVGYGQEKETVTFTDVREENREEPLKIIRHRNGIDPRDEKRIIELLGGENVDLKRVESIQASSSKYKTKWHEKRQ